MCVDIAAYGGICLQAWCGLTAVIVGVEGARKDHPVVGIRRSLAAV